MRHSGQIQIGAAHRHSGAAHACAGFTLIEMLVVILIIAILVASLFAGLRSARQMAWRTRARDTARQIVQAWNLYLNDSREFPLEKQFKDAKEEGGYAATPGNLELLNANRIYLELNETDRQEGLRDRWRRIMGFNLDFDYDGKVANPAPEVFEKAKTVAEMAEVQASAIAWSQGPDPVLKKRWVVQW
jgi:prepilin-type N-terminal cleavage/methylation domain-containing protein